MNPVSTQTCDELTVCTEMDVAAIGDHELRKSIELLIESHEETIGEYKYLNSTYRNNWEVVSFEMDKLAADNVQLRNAVRDLQDSIRAIGVLPLSLFVFIKRPPSSLSLAFAVDVRLSAQDSISLNKSQIGTEPTLYQVTYILAMTTGIQADPAPNLSSATYQSEDDDPRTSDESEPELEYGLFVR
ncbi:hypothetical protein BKA70DRAFT_1444438 [Coprinopsis sp. MPI-PUGE-AT-0042]|nr:hypothetical protein BKA70DRAFT_1444438 [Coprinopsis sp. MPI-PUGE-AT-0042]